jgi:predicted RNase H-like HicB family nuclease
MKAYVVIIGKHGATYGAYSPDVPGCIATGSSIEAAREAMRDALTAHLEGMLEDGDELPAARGLAHYVRADEPIAQADDLITHISVQLPQAA